MRTIIAKPPKRTADRKPLAEGIVICDAKKVQTQSLQSNIKNIIKNPE